MDASDTVIYVCQKVQTVPGKGKATPVGIPCVRPQSDMRCYLLDRCGIESGSWHCISRYTAGGIHIESYFVLVSSCNCWVVRKNKSVMIIIIRALSQWGKDDGDYDSPISRDETPDFMKNKRGQRSPNKKKEAKEAHQNKIKKWEKKREWTMLLSFFHTCASK